jgi:4-amino-4-deoxy-L-arabinose transferase-like glycosyltransferase
MAASMKLFGVGTGAAVDEMVRSPWPELAIRLPSLLAGMMSAAFLGYGIWRLCAPAGDDRGELSRRARTRAKAAGILSALVLSTSPQWAIVTRQALTDMFFVGPVVIAMIAWALAVLQPDRELRRRPLSWPRAAARRGWSIPWDRAYLGVLCVLLLTVAPQLALLHHHVLRAETVESVSRFVKRAGVPTTFTLYQIHLSLLIYWGLLVITIFISARWRTRARCWLGVMYLAGGVSLLGKGMIGPGIIGLLVLVHMIVSGRLALLARSMLWTGALLFTLVALPWHHAMFLYRGQSWFNELIIINNLARFGTGEQEHAVGGFTFYVQTLGLAALPWIAAVPAALWDNVRRAYPSAAEPGAEDASPVRELRRLVLLWLVVTLGLLTYSVTKYLHYLLPVLPPLAALLGLWLAELVSGSQKHLARGTRQTRWVLAAVGLGLGAMIVRDVIYEPAWLAHLTTYLYTSMWREGAPEVTRLAWCVAPFALGLLLWAAGSARAAVCALVFSSLLTTAYVIDDYLPAASENWSQRSAIRVYYDERGPDDPLMSWWFYYRGETFFTKGRVWVLKERNRDKLAAFVDKHEGQDVTLWLITTKSHAKRVRMSLPARARAGVELVYENFHYALLRVPMRPASGE